MNYRATFRCGNGHETSCHLIADGGEEAARTHCKQVASVKCIECKAPRTFTLEEDQPHPSPPGQESNK